MIRLFEQTDTDAIMSIWLESTIQAHSFINKSYWEQSFDTVKNIYLPNSTTYIFEDESIIKGFISIIEDSFIGALFVEIDYQDQGIGSQLLHYATSNYPNLSLCVYNDNVKSTNFYISKGFKILAKQLNEESGYEEFLMRYE